MRAKVAPRAISEQTAGVPEMNNAGLVFLESAETAHADLLSTLAAEAEEDNEAKNRL